MDEIRFAPPKKPFKPLLVGIYRAIIIPGFLRWCLRGFRPSTVWFSVFGGVSLFQHHGHAHRFLLFLGGAASGLGSVGWTPDGEWLPRCGWNVSQNPHFSQTQPPRIVPTFFCRFFFGWEGSPTIEKAARSGYQLILTSQIWRT